MVWVLRAGKPRPGDEGGSPPKGESSPAQARNRLWVSILRGRRRPVRLIKLLSLAAIAASAAMAFIGASSASADSLCSVDNSVNGECLLANRYGIPQTIKALTPTNEPALFLIENNIEMECHSSLLAKTETNEGAHVGLKGILEELTFTNCKSDVCEGVVNDKAENLPYKMLWVGLNQHVFVSAGASGNTPAIIFKQCIPFFKIDCLYELISQPALLDLTLATATKDAHLTALKVPLKTPTPGCAKEFKFDALYVITQPLPFFLTSLP